ncbi:MAG: hypothetical protein HOV80_13620 [Polyangiaceae bacterium]|nr:hypothetical protein [Polyangiaceae bacterium]
MRIAPVRPPRLGGPLTTTGIRLKLPRPIDLQAHDATPLPSYPDPDAVDIDDPISLHDGDYEELGAPGRRPAVLGKSVVLYAVYEGAAPGEVVLRALSPDEPPPEGVTVARLKRVNFAPVTRLRPYVGRR